MKGQLGLCLAATARLEPIDVAFPVRCTTWHKGRPVTVIGHDLESYAEPMVLVAFRDRAGIGIFKRTELLDGPNWNRAA